MRFKSPEIIFQVGGSVSIDGFLEWKHECTCGGERLCAPHVIVAWLLTPCLNFCVTMKRECHAFCFWPLSATASASGCTFVVVSESLRSHLLRGY